MSMDYENTMAARYEREIPEGYEARIEGNKVIIELKESEDERIRKEIIRIVDIWTDSSPVVNGIPRETLLAYLEKQKEQKPAEWSEEDKYILKNIYDFVKENTINPNRVNCAKECLNWLKSLPERFNLQPKQEWSEEDNEKIKRLRSIVNDCAFRNDALDVNGDYCEGDYEELDNWFTFLRPQPHWKPSKEQINALKVVARGFPADDPGVIDSLLADLQKLL